MGDGREEGERIGGEGKRAEGGKAERKARREMKAKEREERGEKT